VFVVFWAQLRSPVYKSLRRHHLRFRLILPPLAVGFVPKYCFCRCCRALFLFVDQLALWLGKKREMCLSRSQTQLHLRRERHSFGTYTLSEEKSGLNSVILWREKQIIISIVPSFGENNGRIQSPYLECKELFVRLYFAVKLFDSLRTPFRRPFILFSTPAKQLRSSSHTQKGARF